MPKRDFEGRARTLLGTRFRPQGRGSEGLDCVGLMLATFAIPDGLVRRDYKLSGEHEAEVGRVLKAFFRKIRPGQVRPGDALLLRPGERQLHFAVKTAGGFIHAHAGLKKVVETPGAPEWPLIGAWRRRTRKA